MAIASFRATFLGDGQSVADIAANGVDATDTTIDTVKVDTADAKTKVAKGTTGGTNYDAAVIALATLVADGASPTQGHVNTFKTSWDLLIVETAAAKVAANLADTDAALAVTASQASQGGVASGLRVDVDLATVTTLTKLARAFRAIQFAAVQAGRFTP